MDQRKDTESRQGVLDFKCKKIVHGVEKSTASLPVQKIATVGKQNLESNIILQTPEKTNELSQTKLKEGEARVPEKYKSVAEFFDSMNCSLRLLGLRKKLPTFENICRQVEVLTKRKFSYGHLAQMKYILPEALQIDKILVHDEKTLCMKPDMKITLLFDVIEGHDEQSDFMALRQVFASRLRKFFTTHPEACDIPEALLPEPFGKKTQITIPEVSPADSSAECESTLMKTEALSESSHLSPSFNRYFSREVVTETENIESTSSALLSSDKSNTLQDVRNSPQKENKDIRGERQEEFPVICSSSIPPQLVKHSSGSVACDSPVVKPVSSSDNIMIETPAQLTPKRLSTSCEDKVETTACPTSSNRKPTKRSLNFLHSEDDMGALDSISDESAFSENLRDSISRTLEMEETSEEKNLAGKKVDEKLGFLTKDHEINQTGLMCPEPSVSLRDLVGLVHHVFKTVNCSSMTKEELVHKILMNNCDLTERSEAEEQIEFLEKLAPDWISRKSEPSGDTFYTIKKGLDLSSVQAKIVTLA